MKISASKTSEEIRLNIEKLECHLPIRIQSLLGELRNEDLGKADEIDLFEIFVRLILRADREPASCIASLMVPLDVEGCNQLDQWTISNSAAFLRDYLEKDQVLYILKTKDENSKNSREETEAAPKDD